MPIARSGSSLPENLTFDSTSALTALRSPLLPGSASPTDQADSAFLPCGPSNCKTASSSEPCWREWVSFSCRERAALSAPQRRHGAVCGTLSRRPGLRTIRADTPPPPGRARGGRSADGKLLAIAGNDGTVRCGTRRAHDQDPNIRAHGSSGARAEQPTRESRCVGNARARLLVGIDPYPSATAAMRDAARQQGNKVLNGRPARNRRRTAPFPCCGLRRRWRPWVRMEPCIDPFVACC